MASLLLPVSTMTLLLLCLSLTNAATIFDMNRQPMLNGENYHIIPYSSHSGLSTAPLQSNSPCPRYIHESRNLGTPITVSADHDAKTRFLSTQLPIKFSFYERFPACRKSPRWWVAEKDSNGDQYVIVGTDGPFQSSYFFKIQNDEKIMNAYNIKFCHVLEFIDFGRLAVVDEECNDVGFLNGRLGITPKKPFPVQFLGFAPRLAS